MEKISSEDDLINKCFKELEKIKNTMRESLIIEKSKNNIVELNIDNQVCINILENVINKIINEQYELVNMKKEEIVEKRKQLVEKRMDNSKYYYSKKWRMKEYRLNADFRKKDIEKRQKRYLRKKARDYIDLHGTLDGFKYKGKFDIKVIDSDNIDKDMVHLIKFEITPII